MYNREDFNGLNGLGFLARNGVRVEMVDTNRFHVYGFYKSGYVEVDFDTNKVTARYNEVTDLTEYYWKDLVDVLLTLNEEWQRKSAGRHADWNKMNDEWQAVAAAYDEAVTS